MRFSEITARVLELAWARNAFWTAHLGREPPATTVRVEALPGAPLPPAPAEAELERFLTSLSPAAVYMLGAVVAIGRGHEDAPKLMRCYEQTSNRFPRPADAARDLLRHVFLADHLEDGLRDLTTWGTDLDELMG